MIKNGVSVLGLAPQMILAYVIAQRIYNRNGHECVITSAVEGKHGNHSHHYKGCAIDLRTRDLSRRDRIIIAEQIRSALGSEYQVVLEDDHLHIEFDPA